MTLLEDQFTWEERELAVEMAEWVAVERHRGAMRARREVRSAVRDRIHVPTQPETSLGVVPNREGYMHALGAVLDFLDWEGGRDADEEVRLIICARLAARRQLERDPSYYTYAEREHARTLDGYKAFDEMVDRADDASPNGMRPPEVQREIERQLQSFWELARQDLRGSEIRAADGHP